MPKEEKKLTAEEIFGEKEQLEGNEPEEEIEEEEPEAEEETEEIEEEEIEEETEPDDEGKPEEEKLYTVKIDGEEKEVTLEELKKSYSYHGHNVSRAQEIAKKEEELEREKARLRATMDELDKSREGMQTAGGERYGDGTFADEMLQYADEPTKRLIQQFDERISRFENEVSQLRKRDYQTRETSAREKVDNIINDFKNKHSDLGDDDVAKALERLDKANAVLTPESLDMAYKAGLDLEAIEKQAVKKYTKGKKKTAEKTATSRGRGKPNTVKPDVTKMSDKERKAAMAKIFGG